MLINKYNNTTTCIKDISNNLVLWKLHIYILIFIILQKFGIYMIYSIYNRQIKSRKIGLFL